MTGLTALVNTDHLCPSNYHEGQLVVEAAAATACLEHSKTKAPGAWGQREAVGVP